MSPDRHPPARLPIEVGDGELDSARFEALLGEARAAARQSRWVEAASADAVGAGAVAW
jgi:hypothetical protein